MLIGLAGPKGIGKSTLAAALIRELDKRGRRAAILPFAGPLKQMATEFYYAAGFGDEAVRARVYGDRKDEPDQIGELIVTPRRLMQTLGTEWGRGCIGDSVWIELWRTGAKRAMTSGFDFIADDLRFDNEARIVKELGGLVIKLGEIDASRDAGEHASEAGVSIYDTVFPDPRRPGVVFDILKLAGL